MPTQPTAQFAETMTRLRRQLVTMATRLQDHLDMPAAAIATLQAIADDATSVSAVARATGQHVSSASRTVHDLVGDGFVQREVDPADRRAVVLSLTAAGTGQLDVIHEHRDHFTTQVLAMLEPDDRRELVRLLDRLADAIEGILAA